MDTNDKIVRYMSLWSLNNCHLFSVTKHADIPMGPISAIAELLVSDARRHVALGSIRPSILYLFAIHHSYFQDFLAPVLCSKLS